MFHTFAFAVKVTCADGWSNCCAGNKTDCLCFLAPVLKFKWILADLS